MNRYVRLLGGGALCGFAWGVVARLWMRYISTEPEFSWGGTIYIVLAPTMLGLAAGLYAARPRWWTRVLAIATLIPLGMGAGAMMLPTVAFGAIAWSRKRLATWARAIYALLACPLAVLIVIEISGDFGAAQTVVGALWYLVLVASIIMIASVGIAGSEGSEGSEGGRAASSAVDLEGAAMFGA